MTALRLVLGDQLTPGLSCLRGLDAARDVVFMAEVMGEATYVRHHKQKIAFVFSAMRHFATDLRGRGIRVEYVRLDDPANTGTLASEVARAIQLYRPDELILTEPGEWRILEMMLDWREEFPLPVRILEDDRFIASRDDFSRWASGRKSLRMEFFYRELRRRTGLLMAGGEPLGGQWNFDAENRKPLPAGLVAPQRLRFPPDEITREALDLVAARFGDHFGDLEPFGWPVTRGQALQALDHFIEVCLPSFGDYQDAMKTGEDFAFHSLVSPCLNAGLLTPLEVCKAAESAFASGRAPLNSAEGFIRQVLGWREFVRGVYWRFMPDYARTNALEARRPLPDFYWTGQTDMACMRACIKSTRRHAYAHHIQRLMVTGNFALLAGVAPADIEEWYLAVYLDAYEWVELPNVHGMAIHADGGVLGSKPYAASGAYINRMSDYCKACRFSPRAPPGPTSCPFNALYWDFLERNGDRLRKNPRMALPYRALDAMSEDLKAAHLTRAAAVLADLQPWIRPGSDPDPGAAGSRGKPISADGTLKNREIPSIPMENSS